MRKIHVMSLEFFVIDCMVIFSPEETPGVQGVV